MHNRTKLKTKNSIRLLAELVCSMLRIGALLTTLLTLTSCSFNIQPANSLPQQLYTLNLQTEAPYDEFTATLKHALAAAGVTITTTAPYALHLASTSFTHTNSNSFLSTQARIYSFTLSTTLSLTNAQNKTILPMQQISTTRTITLSPNEILQASNQEEIAYEEMQQELIVKIFNILKAPNITQQFTLSKTT